MRSAAVILNQEVINVIVIDQENFLALKDDYKGCILADTDTADFNVEMGDKFIDNKFYKKVPSNDEQRENRRINYVKYADPLFFRMQRGEVSKAQYEECIESIKLQFPFYYDDNGNLDMNKYNELINPPSDRFINPQLIIERDKALSSNT